MVHEGLSDPIVTQLVAQDKVPWYRKPNLRVMYLWLFLVCMGVEMTSGFDSTLINTLQFSTPWNKYFSDGCKDAKGLKVICPPLKGFVNSSYQLGSVIGVPFAPWISQKFGRRWSIMGGSIIMVFGSIIQGCAQNVGMYIFARMALGLGIVACIISGSSLIGELGYPKERAILTSFFNTSYFIGSIVASAIAIKYTSAKNDMGWRIPSWLQMCPSLLQICFVFMLPESPRWLVSKDRADEALAILVKYHAEGDADSVLVQAEMAQIQTTIKLEYENSKQSYYDMFKHAGMRRRLVIAGFLGLFTQMSGNTLISYSANDLYIALNYTTDYAKTRINIANACWGLITSFIAAIFVARLPRRFMFMLSALCMLCIFTAFTVCIKTLSDASHANPKRHNSGASIAGLFFYFAFSPAYNIGNNAITYTYLVELFPFAQRTRGIGFEQFFGRLGGFFTTNVNPIAMPAIGWKFMAIYCGWITFEFLFIFFMYPETSGRTLEELTFLFEEKELADKAVIAVEKRIHHEDMVPADSLKQPISHTEVAEEKV
ncbi:hexose transporter-like protein [Tricladium varicosporioides]|nr:hexose transporter-like protein [Hymenoscyphus varicosporioides]